MDYTYVNKTIKIKLITKILNSVFLYPSRSIPIPNSLNVSSSLKIKLGFKIKIIVEKKIKYKILFVIFFIIKYF